MTSDDAGALRGAGGFSGGADADQVQRGLRSPQARGGGSDLRGGGSLRPERPVRPSLAGAGKGGPGNRAKPYAGVGGWRCPRLWPGSTIVCIGGGPSLTRADLDYLAERRGDGSGEPGFRAIAVNDGIKLAPWADVVYAADITWWRAAQAYVPAQTIKISCQDSEFRDINVLRYRRGAPFETDPHWVAIGYAKDERGVTSGGNSGHQAVNIAAHLGASRIVLLGYDMCAGPRGELHWFGSHPSPLSNPNAGNLARWAKAMDAAAPLISEQGIEVINCSRRTAITAFRRAALEEVFP